MTDAIPHPDDAANLLADCRERIDRIDAAVVALLQERVRTALEAGRAKAALGQPVAAPEREAEVLRRVVALCGAPLDPATVRRIFSAIIEATRNAEHLGSRAPSASTHVSVDSPTGLAATYEPRPAAGTPS